MGAENLLVLSLLCGDLSLLATAAVGLFLERPRCCVESVCVLELGTDRHAKLPDEHVRELSSQAEISDNV